MLIGNESQGLKTVLVDKLDLIEKLVKNRQNHVEEFNEAIAGFKEKYQETLRVKIDLAQRHDKYDHRISFDIPKSHEEDYTSVIEMLEMSVDTEVEITYEQFQRYVRDQWDWQAAFKSISASYK